MKRSLVFLTLLFFAFSSLHAQTAKGNYLLGGNILLDISSQKNEFDGEVLSETNTTLIGFTPKIGVFFSDVFVGGINLGFLSESTSNDTYTTLIAGPFIRLYYDAEEKISLFGHAGFNFMKPDLDEDASATSFEIGPGFAFFVSESVAVEALLTYQNTSLDWGGESDGKTTSSDIIFSVGVQAYLGGN
jgi:hypothetical protein